MKITAHQLGAVLRDPAPYAAILFYGEDTGRIRDHIAAATRAVLGTTSDPFRSSVLTREEHGRLRTELSSLSLIGGRRVVQVQDATDGLAPALEGLGNHREDVLVLLEGASLTGRSKLRTLAERRADWAAVACYPETGMALATEVRRVLEQAGLTGEPAAIAYLAQQLGGDSQRRRSELNKLCLYAAEGLVTLEMAQLCCSAGLEASLGAAVAAALSGHGSRCDALLQELAREGATGPGLLAVLGGQVQRLLRVRLAMADGSTAEDACRLLQPPVFPRQMPAFLQEVQRWSVARLEALGAAVRTADAACKRAAAPDFAIAARLLGNVAAMRR